MAISVEARNGDGVMPGESLPAGAKMDRKNDTKSEKAIRLLRPYGIGTKSYLAMNVCYTSRRGKNDPKGNSESIRAASPQQFQNNREGLECRRD